MEKVEETKCKENKVDGKINSLFEETACLPKEDYVSV